jgi:hypothetical protein
MQKPSPLPSNVQGQEDWVDNLNSPYKFTTWYACPFNKDHEYHAGKCKYPK